MSYRFVKLGPSSPARSPLSAVRFPTIGQPVVIAVPMTHVATLGHLFIDSAIAVAVLKLTPAITVFAVTIPFSWTVVLIVSALKAPIAG